MTLTINLPPTAEDELARRADELGVDSATLASLLLQDRLRGMTDDVPDISPDEHTEIMESVRRSEQDLAEGKVRSLSQVKRDKAKTFGIEFGP